MTAPLKRERPLRVFMTADAVGGVWPYALDLADGLRPHRAEIVLAVLGPKPSAGQEHAAREAGVSLIVAELPLDWTAASASEVEKAAQRIARMAAEAHPDIVHLNSPALAGAAAFPAPVVAVAHSCVATWWAANRSGPLPPDFIWRSEMTGRGYRVAQAVAAPTAAFAAATQCAYGLPRAPLVVRNGRRPAGLSPVAAEPFVFTAGRLWDEGKNLAALDRAAARVAVPVLAAGPFHGPNSASIALQSIQALGPLDDLAVAQRLSARPVFVSTARYEPFGLAVLEAAQAGCALILSDIPTFRELWDGAALFVPADDDAALAEAIDALSRDPETRARLGEAAQKRSEAYSVEAMCAGILEVYQAVLADPSLDTVGNAA